MECILFIFLPSKPNTMSGEQQVFRKLALKTCKHWKTYQRIDLDAGDYSKYFRIWKKEIYCWSAKIQIYLKAGNYRLCLPASSEYKSIKLCQFLLNLKSIIQFLSASKLGQGKLLAYAYQEKMNTTYMWELHDKFLYLTSAMD